MLPATIVLIGLWAYANSFSGAFVFDDLYTVVENRSIRQLWPLWRLLAPPRVGSWRPLVNCSLALNYAISGLHVWSYHGFNLVVHLSAALVLFGIVRRTLLHTSEKRTACGGCGWVAGAVAALWMVHPLQTESVTYLIQRAESLAGLGYLLSVYCLTRSASSYHRTRWYVAGFISCALGMASKPVAATAPLAVLLYDGLFISGSLRAAWQHHRRFHLSLASTWGLLALLLSVSRSSDLTAGFASPVVGTPGAYALTQIGVMAHYLRLSLWPNPLVLDYHWPLARTAQGLLPSMLLIGALGAATLWALRRYPRLGFLGGWFFLTLAPSSSFIPIADPAAEHRMYLPLAAVVAVGVSAADRVLRTLCGTHHQVRRLVVVGVFVMVLMCFMQLTIRRNADYASELSMWSDVVAKQPHNPRGYVNLGRALAQQGQVDTAISYYAEALRLEPRYAQAHNNWGIALLQQGQLETARAHLMEAQRLQPDSAEIDYNLGNVLAKQDRFEEAIAQYSNALRLNADLADAHNNWGNVLVVTGHHEEAAAHYREALRIEPAHRDARHNLMRLGTQQGLGGRADVWSR